MPRQLPRHRPLADALLPRDHGQAALMASQMLTVMPPRWMPLLMPTRVILVLPCAYLVQSCSTGLPLPGPTN